MATWSVFGKEFLSGELSNTAKFQPVTFNKNIILKAARVWIISISDPTYTSLNMKIYSSEPDSAGRDKPNKLIFSSTNSVTKAQIQTLAHANKEIFFQFDDEPMQQNTKYHFVVNGVGYSPTAGTNFLAWRQGFPDPVLRTGLSTNDISLQRVNKLPYTIYFIGAEY